MLLLDISVEHSDVASGVVAHTVNKDRLCSSWWNRLHTINWIG
ncbi:hypothetical protein BHAP_1321 [Bifidobacterium hapali]|uniref:Uncharacterized protein n=1 Tax=Bifidobacterium hapali TaxID=1630172 RepID=A0A261FY85_9BIFI|nr:hypothetical protein BHAP_1321 [Bifidobacterium hapali]